MGVKTRFVLWCVIFSIPFLFLELSFMFSPFSVYPDWIIYLLDIVLGFSIVTAVGDFKIGTFVDLFGMLFAMVLYFFVGKFILRHFGMLNDTFAANFTLGMMALNFLVLYTLSVLGNLVAMLVSGIV